MNKVKYIYYNTLLEYYSIKLNYYLKLKNFSEVELILSLKKSIAPKLRLVC